MRHSPPARRMSSRLGRLSRDKGFDVLIDAFARVKTQDATLSIAGKGPERDALQARIHALGLSDRVAAGRLRRSRGRSMPARGSASSRRARRPLASSPSKRCPPACRSSRPIATARAKSWSTAAWPNRADRGRAAMAAAIDAALADPGDPAPRIARREVFSVAGGLRAWSDLLDEVVENARSGERRAASRRARPSPDAPAADGARTGAASARAVE